MTILNRFTNNSVKTLADAPVIELNAEDAPHYQVTITANRTLANPSNPTFAKDLWLAIAQDVIGGHTLTFDTAWVSIDSNVILNQAPGSISVLHATARNFGSGVKWYYSVDSTTTINSGGTTSVVKMADLSALAGQPGNIVTVLGFYTANDGGGGDFYWVPNGVATPVPGMVVNATGGQWVRIRSDQNLNVLWFGAYGDASHDDTSAIKAAIGAMTGGVSELYFPGGPGRGTYFISDDLIIGSPGPELWGLSFRGEAAGHNYDTMPRIKWNGPASKKSTGMVHVVGFDHQFTSLSFDGRGPSQSQTNCKRGGVAIGGHPGFGYSPGASHIKFNSCQIIGFEVGIGLGLDGTITSNLEECIFDDCLFWNYEIGIWIRRGQPYNTSILRCKFGRFPPSWQATGVDGSGNANPYGIGIYIWDDAGNSSGTTWIDTPNFNYVAIGVYCPGQPSNLTIRNVDSENMKRLLWLVGGLGYNAQALIQSGRYDLSALDYDRIGETYNHTLDIPGTDYSYIKMASGNLLVEGNGFSSGNASAKFFLEYGATVNVVSKNNYYPNIRPLKRNSLLNPISSDASGTVHQWLGATFSQGDMASSQAPSAGAGIFIPDEQVPSHTLTRLPTLNGAENGDGFVTISDTATSAAVSLAITEPICQLFTDGQTVNYRVHLDIQQVEPGAIVGVPYVTNPTGTGFTVNLSTAPGTGKSIRIGWAMYRAYSPNPGTLT